ncbi:MAG TPA: integration host factor subunit beta [Candidatus Latescibacteria bacterium]|nr:integration host factor subunit beta [Candidatus Handelsmanbacteria bacterium]HIL10305.1 integration host factor subunit beta [Candidatus Latescibacterota bacterium]
MATITKKDLARSVADAIGCKNNLTLQMVDSLFEAMRETLIEGNRIEIRGFGVLEVKNTKPKPAARNPRTGEVVYVPARRKTHFKPGKQLKEALHNIRPENSAADAAAVSSPTPAPTPAPEATPSATSQPQGGSWSQ